MAFNKSQSKMCVCVACEAWRNVAWFSAKKKQTKLFFSPKFSLLLFPVFFFFFVLLPPSPPSEATMANLVDSVACLVEGGDSLFSCVVEVGGVDDWEARFSEDSAAFLDVGAFETDNERQFQANLLASVNDALGN